MPLYSPSSKTLSRLKILAAFALFFLTVFLLLGCNKSDPELKHYKINKEYSEKISSKTALLFIEFVETAALYHQIAFIDKEYTETQDTAGKRLYTILKDVNEMKANNELNDVEKEISHDIVLIYAMDIHNSLSMLENQHKIAIINKELGITENNEYVDIDDKFESIKNNSNELIEKFDKYFEER